MAESTAAVPQPNLSNEEIARCLETVADLLEAQNANPYRVRAYRNGAQTVRSLPRPVGVILEESGVAGLIALPAIGRALARAIEQLVDSGKLALLAQLRGDVATERVFTTVPTVGPKLAARIHDQLGIETLADLQAAAYDGRLSHVPGFGPGRVRAVQESLAGRLRGRPLARPATPTPPANEPAVGELLDVDREYRRKVEADRLHRIAPRRFNPTGAAWLPILHTVRGQNHYTALFSNTSHAHELGATHDWVVIYRDDAQGDGRWTVVTSRFGPLAGRRIVRGREDECRRYYADKPVREAVVA